MENYGLIIRHLRGLAGLTLQATAKKIGRSVGWLSEIENTKGECKLTEMEFDRIVTALDGNRHRRMFMTWVATSKNRSKTVRTFDGAILKFLRVKKKLKLVEAAKRIGISAPKLSKLETGILPVTWDLRDKIMESYGYSPSSFKNLNSDPVRSKAVPLIYKLEILLNGFQEDQIEEMYEHALKIIKTTQEVV